MTATDLQEEIRTCIQELIRNSKMRQVDIADECGVAARHITRIMNNKSYVSPRLATRIAKACGGYVLALKPVKGSAS